MISIVIPVYNVEKYISNTIDSIINQTYKDYELILVNDGSTDNTANVIREHMKDATINWQLLEKENGGQSSAKNYGFKHSKGEYIVYLDSDDVISPEFLETLYSMIDEDADFSFCNFKFVSEQIPPVDEDCKPQVINRDEALWLFLKRQINFVCPSMLIKRSFLEENDISFNEDIRFSEDQMFIWDVFFRCKKCIYTKKVMYGYYLREKSIMTSSPYNKIMKGFKVYKDFCNNLLELFPEDKELTEMILPRWSLGTLYSSAKLVDYKEYKSLYDTMDGRHILNNLSNIKDRNSYILALISKLSPKLLYFLCRKVTL